MTRKWKKSRNFVPELSFPNLFSPVWGGGEANAGGQSVNGGTHEGGHRPYEGGPNFKRLYYKLKVLLLLLILL